MMEISGRTFFSQYKGNHMIILVHPETLHLQSMLTGSNLVRGEMIDLFGSFALHFSTYHENIVLNDRTLIIVAGIKQEMKNNQSH